MRIVWLPGTDLLQGECHCGATHVDEDPAAMWDWLLAHPVGHGGTESVTEERVLATVR
ncbi:hypothetical protein [Rhodococcoides trifolii]